MGVFVWMMWYHTHMDPFTLTKLIFDEMEHFIGLYLSQFILFVSLAPYIDRKYMYKCHCSHNRHAKSGGGIPAALAVGFYTTNEGIIPHSVKSQYEFWWEILILGGEF